MPGLITPDDVKAKHHSSLEEKKSSQLPLYRTLYNKMSAPRILHRLARPVPSSLSTITRLNGHRQFGATALRLKDGNDEAASGVKAHRANQTDKVPNQFVPNTTSTMTKDFPSVGEKPPPPEMLNSADPNYRPSDPYPGRIEHFTGGRQDDGARKPELEVGEMEGITFKIEPLKRVGEDLVTKRARLLCSYPFPCMLCTSVPNQSRGPGASMSRMIEANQFHSRPKPQAWNPRVGPAPLDLRRCLPGQDGLRSACRV